MDGQRQLQREALARALIRDGLLVYTSASVFRPYQLIRGARSIDSATLGRGRINMIVNEASKVVNAAVKRQRSPFQASNQFDPHSSSC
jgi:hypothetical protein